MTDNDEFSIQRITGSFSGSEDIILEETSTTCLIFRPKVHSGGVRGELIRFKVEQGKRVEPERINFQKLTLHEGTFTTLDTQSVAKLVRRVHDLYEANRLVSPWKRSEKFTVAKVDTVIDDSNKLKYIKQLLSRGYTDDFWDELVKSDPDLATRLSWARIYAGYDEAIVEFRESIKTKSSDEVYWQAFFERNVWMLQTTFSYPVIFLEGDVYVGGKKSKTRQGSGGVATDYLFMNESSRSFAVIEIKTPDTELIGGLYRGRKDEQGANEVYSMHSKLSGSIVQTQTQISVARAQFPAVLAESFGNGLNATHPHGILLIGRHDLLTEEQQTSFNHFRFGYKDITIITFDELLARLSAIIGHRDGVNAESDSDDEQWIKVPSKIPDLIKDFPF